MIACAGLNQPAAIPDTGGRAFGLFAGCGAKICSVFVHAFLRMKIDAGNFNRRQNFFMRQTVIPAQVIKSLSIGEIILPSVFEHIPDFGRQEADLHRFLRALLMVLLRIVRNSRHGIAHKQLSPVTAAQIIGFPAFGFVRLIIIMKRPVRVQPGKTLLPSLSRRREHRRIFQNRARYVFSAKSCDICRGYGPVAVAGHHRRFTDHMIDKPDKRIAVDIEPVQAFVVFGSAVPIHVHGIDMPLLG